MGSIPAGPLYRAAGPPMGQRLTTERLGSISQLSLGCGQIHPTKWGQRGTTKYQSHTHPRISRAGKGGPCRKLGLVEDLAGITSDIGEAEALCLTGAGGI